MFAGIRWWRRAVPARRRAGAGRVLAARACGSHDHHPGLIDPLRSRHGGGHRRLGLDGPCSRKMPVSRSARPGARAGAPPRPAFCGHRGQAGRRRLPDGRGDLRLAGRAVAEAAARARRAARCPPRRTPGRRLARCAPPPAPPHPVRARSPSVVKAQAGVHPERGQAASAKRQPRPPQAEQPPPGCRSDGAPSSADCRASAVRPGRGRDRGGLGGFRADGAQVARPVPRGRLADRVVEVIVHHPAPDRGGDRRADRARAPDPCAMAPARGAWPACAARPASVRRHQRARLPRPRRQPLQEARRQAPRVGKGRIAAGPIRPADPVLRPFHPWALARHPALHPCKARFLPGRSDDAPRAADRIAEAACRSGSADGGPARRRLMAVAIAAAPRAPKLDRRRPVGARRIRALERQRGRRSSPDRMRDMRSHPRLLLIDRRPSAAAPPRGSIRGARAQGPSRPAAGGGSGRTGRASPP
jgi:hypothetical protein